MTMGVDMTLTLQQVTLDKVTTFLLQGNFTLQKKDILYLD